MPEEVAVSGESKQTESILTVTFNDWSVQIFSHVTEWHIDNKTLWFQMQPNAIKNDKTYCVPIQSIKMYGIETLR